MPQFDSEIFELRVSEIIKMRLGLWMIADSVPLSQQRSEVAQEEFNTHGLGDLVKCAHRDVCADGFGLEGVADAVFLDLPHPWLAVEHAVKALKDTGGRICSFSPCIEQVQRTCEKLRELRCIEITTVECLERPFEVKRVQMAKQSSDSKKGLEYFLGEDGLPFETTPAESEQMETNGASCKDRNYILIGRIHISKTNFRRSLHERYKLFFYPKCAKMR